MKISEKDMAFLIKHFEEAEELIEEGAVGDLLVLIEDALIEDEIASEDDDEPTNFWRRLQEVYDRIDEDNPE